MISIGCRIVCSGGMSYPWVRVENPTTEEIQHLDNHYHLPQNLIQEVLDPHELSRSELISEIPVRLIIMRVPSVELWNGSSRTTTQTLCLCILNDVLISISNAEVSLFQKDFFLNQHIKVESISCFVLQILLYSASAYLHCLKVLDGLISEIESQLEHVFDNRKVIRLFKIERSLHYFETALRSNEILLEKLPKSYLPSKKIEIEAIDGEQIRETPTSMQLQENSVWIWGSAEKELFQDVSIEMREAFEITDVYLKILHSMTSAFSSVADNHLNITMKRLTLISVVLMLPTLIASFFGMNVVLPFASLNNNLHFWIIAGFSVGVSFIMLIFLKLGKFF